MRPYKIMQSRQSVLAAVSDSLGLNQLNLPTGVLVLVSSLGVAAILTASQGSVIAGGAFVAALLLVGLTVWRIEWGFYALIGSVLVFDQIEVPGYEESVTFKASYFLNLKENPYLPSFSPAVVSPLELHILMLIFVWFVLAFTRKDLMLSRINVWGATLLFFCGVAGSFLFGMRTGGDFLVALWELRALFYFGLIYVLTPQFIQTREQVHTLMWVCIAAISLKAFQGIARFAQQGFSFQGLALLTNHEDPLFILTLTIFLFGLVLFNARTRQRIALILLLFPLMMGFYTGQRRAGYAAILPSFAVFVSLLSTKERWILARSLSVVLLVLGLYTVAFWNSESRLASPVRLVKTGLSLDPETAGERYYSNLYREIEKFDLAVTVRKSSIVGVGFGNKYEEPLPLVDISYPLRDYIPHNTVLWLIVKMGSIGFFLFWFFVNSFAFKGSFIFSRLKDPYLKAVCAMSLSAIAGQIIVAYFDLQFTFYRNMLYLGMLMGLLPILEAIDKKQMGVPENSETRR